MHVCVSISTRVHAGLCRGPDCQPSARHCSSGPGPRCNASAGTRLTRLCVEGWPVQSENMYYSNRLGEVRWYILIFFAGVNGQSISLPGKWLSMHCPTPPAGDLSLHSRWSTKPTEGGTENDRLQTPTGAAAKDKALKLFTENSACWYF